MTNEELYTLLWILFMVGWWNTIPLFLGLPENEVEEELWF